ncbi:MAG TPA: DUF1080 domain-containing protein [Flavisolibacter sp.]|jgi:hypothetical protein|nr:DUF1080 domain-containing protein [Flavisolibacter sp.]
MKQLLASLLLVTLLSCNNDTTTQTTAAKDTAMAQPATDSTVHQDWINLTGPGTRSAWHSYGRDSLGSAWKSDSNTMHLDATVKNDWQTKNGGDIVTNEEFDNFELQLEWKIAKAGNSGIMIYVHEDTANYKYPWETGPEMQVADNENHPDGKIDKCRAGDLYDLMGSKPAVRPYYDWNQVTITANKGRVEFMLNGQVVLSTTLWDEAWKQLIAKSKFKTMPGFGTFRKGRIALQDHGADVWYRNVRIRRI